MPQEFQPVAGSPLRRRLFEIIFRSDPGAGRAFDLVLIVAIVASVGVVMLDSVESIRAAYARQLIAAEWFFTGVFTVEYVVRLWVVRQPLRYARSFFGVVDLLSVLPTYISLLVPGAQVLLSVRILRTLRIFRVLKLASYLDEADQLGRALAASRRKILVFVFAVLTIVTVMGSAMYLIENGENGFTSIPQSVYWAVVTLATVGYGDIYPVTALGKGLATVIIIMGYGIIAVPTGIVTAEMTREQATRGASVAAEAAVARQLAQCPRCGMVEHDADARFCKLCGEPITLAPEAEAPPTEAVGP
ncbi:MAG: ion transporter [Bacteroidota bacterium]